MLVLPNNRELRHFLSQSSSAGSLAFVPTMGALHAGHLDLVRRASEAHPRVLVSIFVNPIQFNTPDDLQHYPRQLEADIAALREQNFCTAVYCPQPEDVYPEGPILRHDIPLKGLDQTMEGRFRPGHFNGVVTVVKRLFDLIEPQAAFFGEKDFQQVRVIQEMTAHFQLPIRIVACPVVRDLDGLAYSSRNALLLPHHRAEAPQLYAFLQKVRTHFQSGSQQSELTQLAERWAQSLKFGKLEYFEIADENTLFPLMDRSGPARAFLVVRFNEVRLIDNLSLMP